MNRHAIPDIDLRHELAARNLECHLLVAATPPDPDQSFPVLLCAELQDLLRLAYHGNTPTAEHFRYETWAVTLRAKDSADLAACATLAFSFDLPSYFHTHFEAVRPSLQRTGLGRLLYACIEVWARFLILNDPLVLDGVMRSDGDYCVVSTIDRDDDDDHCARTNNRQGHGTFLRKLGYIRAQHDFRQDDDREIAFQRAFRVPLGPDPEE
jgi:GNAT superfamily N-acetyltransferase